MKIHKVLQNGIEWMELRSGKPTASRFSDVITPKTLKPSKSNYHNELAAEILAGYDCDEWVGNKDTDHGLESEHVASLAYMNLTGLEPELVGFVTNDDETIGCSPDRLVGEDGILEIKSLRASKVIQVYSEWLNTGETPVDYKMQIQGQLMITERAWCDLALYHPKLSLKVIRVTPDLNIHERLRDRLKVLIGDRDKAVSQNSGF